MSWPILVAVVVFISSRLFSKKEEEKNNPKDVFEGDIG